MTTLNFPANPTEGQIFQSEVDNRKWKFTDGAWRLFGINSIESALRLERYDLAIADSTDGSGDLETAQVFKIDNTTATAKTVSFTNPPAGRAMTVIVEVTGNAGAINMDAGVTVAKDLDTSLSPTQTVFVFFWNGESFKLMSVTRMG